MTTACQPKIFGIGLSKTGTTSLHAALVLMGFASIHYFYPEGWLKGDFAGDELADFDAALDMPVPAFYAELDRRYPGSKFIYTVREDREAWLGSLERQFRASKPWRGLAPLRLCVYGVERFSRAHMEHAYATHDRKVREYFRGRPNDLLVLDVFGGDGWAKLSRFLKRSSPPLPFPALKPIEGDLAIVRRKEIKAKKARMESLVFMQTAENRGASA